MDLPSQAETLYFFFELFPQRAFSNQDQMGVRTGSGALRERFQQQRVIFLWGKTRHTHKENLIVAETLLCPPFVSLDLRLGISGRCNTVGDNAALWYPIQTLQAECHFFGNSYRDYPVLECEIGRASCR